MAKKKNLGGRPRTNPAPKAFDRMVGARIRVRRTIMKMSTTDLAKKSGKSLSQIYRYESGDTSISTQALVKIASVLKCSVNDLAVGLN